MLDSVLLHPPGRGCAKVYYHLCIDVFPLNVLCLKFLVCVSPILWLIRGKLEKYSVASSALETCLESLMRSNIYLHWTLFHDVGYTWNVLIVPPTADTLTVGFYSKAFLPALSLSTKDQTRHRLVTLDCGHGELKVSCLHKLFLVRARRQ